MLKKCYIGIDTSNYTTSLSAVDERGEVLVNLKAPLPVKEGACGLRQSDAVFAHVKHIPLLMRRLQEALEGYTPVAVGVSARPRDAADSYMPCFLSGVAAAESFAAGMGLPVYTFSHQNGHVMAALMSSGGAERLFGRAFGAFHVSGGTTEMLLVPPRGKDFDISLVGESADLHAGQAIDRIGVAMGLSFPCGPALEQLAAQNQSPVPRPRVSVTGGVCHLSGLENLALKLYRESGDARLTAAYVLAFLAETLTRMARHFREEHRDLPLLFAGGVMSNRIIADTLKRDLGGEILFAEPAFSADNAAGIAYLCRARASEH